MTAELCFQLQKHSGNLRKPASSGAWWLLCNSGDEKPVCPQQVLSALPPVVDLNSFPLQFSSLLSGVSSQPPSGLQKPRDCWCLTSTQHSEGKLSVRRRQEVEANQGYSVPFLFNIQQSIYLPTHPPAHSPPCSPSHSCIHPPTHPPSYSTINPFTLPPTQLPSYFPTQPFTPHSPVFIPHSLPTQSFIHFPHSPIHHHSPIHPHLPIHPFTPT